MTTPPESNIFPGAKVNTGKFEPDQYIRVKGKLKLNDVDLEHGNFILEEAVVMK